MAAFFGDSPEEVAESLDGEVVAFARLTPRVVLAVDAAEGAMGEEDGAGAPAAADGRFLAEMGPVAEDARQDARAAVTGLSGDAVDAAGAGARRGGASVVLSGLSHAAGWRPLSTMYPVPHSRAVRGRTSRSWVLFG